MMQDMRKRLDPPQGVTATLAGLPVLAADANHALSDPLRRMLTALAGLALVALALFAVYRSWERAWVPLVPIALATGWSALVLWLIGVPLNPMSAALSALVIAISTEFSVLLSARYREERAAGFDAADALARTYASTGAAVLASGVTAIAGFAVLIASDIAMLRDFGLVTVIDLAVSLLGVLAVLPAVLVLAERRAAAGGSPRRAPPRRRGRPSRAVACSCEIAAGLRREAAGGAARGLRGRAARVDHVQLGRDRDGGVAGAAGGRRAAAVRDAALDLGVQGALRRERGDGGRPGRGGREAGVLGARARGPELVRAGRGRAVRAGVRLRAGRALPRPAARRCSASRRAIPRSKFRVVAVRADAATARSLRTTLPVGYDHDGAVSNEYAVVVCPTITYVRRGGEVAGSSVGPLGEAALEEWVKRIAS